MSFGFTETNVEEATLAWLAELGYAVTGGQDIAPDSHKPERTSYDDVALNGRLGRAVARLNPAIPAEARADGNWGKSPGRQAGM